MSHLASLKTQIKNLDVARMAAIHLGLIPQGPGQVSAMDGRTVHCDERFDHPQRNMYLHGLRRQADDTYTLWGEQCGEPSTHMNCYGPYFRYNFRETRRLYPDCQLWVNDEDGTRIPVPADADLGPTRFLMEYALQSAVFVGVTQGMAYSRQPADPVADDAQAGAEKIVLSGGYLPPHITLHVIGQPDGTARVRIDGATDSTCYLYTKPFEDAIGAVLTDTPLSALDLAHSTTAGQVCHIARG